MNQMIILLSTQMIYQLMLKMTRQFQYQPSKHKKNTINVEGKHWINFVLYQWLVCSILLLRLNFHHLSSFKKHTPMQKSLLAL
jgi:hypothetical protein